MIVSNSSPLIYLAKIKKIYLLKELFHKVLIPLEVKQDIVDEGKKRGEADAFLIEKEISEGWIKVEKVHTLLKWDFNIHLGEKAAISLAKQKNQSLILVDEVAARTAAKIVQVEPKGTIFVLLSALKEQIITFDEFLHSLTLLAQTGLRLREEVYTLAIEEARKMSKK